MTDRWGITCYLQDEKFCDDPVCVRTGCKLQNATSQRIRDEDHPDCSTPREIELYDALMLLASLMLNKQQALYSNGVQGGVRVAPIVSKALRLTDTSAYHETGK